MLQGSIERLKGLRAAGVEYCLVPMEQDVLERVFNSYLAQPQECSCFCIELSLH